MVHLLTTTSAFQARVIAARLGAEGFLVELRGAGDGLYPLGWPVEVLVHADNAEEARELLLADQVAAVLEGSTLEEPDLALPAGWDITGEEPAGGGAS